MRLDILKVESVVVSISMMRQLSGFAVKLSTLQVYLYVTVILALWFALEALSRLTLMWIEGKPRRDHDAHQ